MANALAYDNTSFYGNIIRIEIPGSKKRFNRNWEEKLNQSKKQRKEFGFSIFVGNLPFDITNLELRELFSDCGNFYF